MNYVCACARRLVHRRGNKTAAKKEREDEEEEETEKTDWKGMHITSGDSDGGDNFSPWLVPVPSHSICIAKTDAPHTILWISVKCVFGALLFFLSLFKGQLISI